MISLTTKKQAPEGAALSEPQLHHESAQNEQ